MIHGLILIKILILYCRRASSKSFPPPKTLHDLLSDIIDVKRADLDHKNLDNVIQRHFWARSFWEYLNKLKLDDEKDIFKFLILTEYLIQLEDSKPANNNDQLRSGIFKLILRQYFSKSSKTQIALSNQTRFKTLAEYAAKDDTECNQETIGVLMKAREDPKVISDGLDPTYVDFLAQAPTSPSKLACILSIL